MKKIFLIVIEVCLLVFVVQSALASATITASYTYEEERPNKLSNGFDYLGYSGLLEFSSDYSGVTGAGAVFERVDDTFYSKDVPVVGSSEDNCYSMRFSGRGMRSGDYKLTPYVIVDGQKKMGDTIEFSISESSEAMTNLRIAYGQIQLIEFETHEQALLDIVLPAVSGTIEAGENGAKVSKQYVKNNYASSIANAKSLYYDTWTSKQRSAFTKKLGVIDTQARAFLMTFFYY